jgi:hypothetical protein
MRKQKIRSLARKLQPPKGPGPLYFHARNDPAGSLRLMINSAVIVSENEIRRQFDLAPMALYFPDMTLLEISGFVGSIGPIIPFRDNPDGPGRIPDIDLYRGTRRA